MDCLKGEEKQSLRFSSGTVSTHTSSPGLSSEQLTYIFIQRRYINPTGLQISVLLIYG